METLGSRLLAQLASWRADRARETWFSFSGPRANLTTGLWTAVPRNPPRCFLPSSRDEPKPASWSPRIYGPASPGTSGRMVSATTEKMYLQHQKIAQITLKINFWNIKYSDKKITASIWFKGNNPITTSIHVSHNINKQWRDPHNIGNAYLQHRKIVYATLEFNYRNIHKSNKKFITFIQI